MIDLSSWIIFFIIKVFLISSTIVLAILCFGLLYIRSWVNKSRNSRPPESKKIVAFFHPYCNAGGGGERVLWAAASAIYKRYPHVQLVVYTGDVEEAPDQILAKARERFKMKLDFEDSIKFVYLHRRIWVEASSFPYVTLLGQSLGSVYLGLEALFALVPDIYIDTMGYAFTLPLFKYIGGSKVGCYVHYPTISTDMLDAVRSRRYGYNNRRSIASSKLFSRVKLYYYKLFSYLYGVVGRTSDVVLVNSSWTEEHISSLWKKEVHRVYPPCDVSEFSKIDTIKDSERSEYIICSIGQFRPEKDHALQLKSLFELRLLLSEEEWDKVKLVIIGGVRNAEDEKRVQDLKDLSKHLAIEDNVEFKVNVTFEELKDQMKRSIIGIHTMWNEHFGIAIVEMLAAGLITLAHRSGGPLMDIVIEDPSSQNGFLAIQDKEYALSIAHILDLDDESRDNIRERARDSVSRFSDQAFETSWLRSISPLFS